MALFKDFLCMLDHLNLRRTDTLLYFLTILYKGGTAFKISCLLPQTRNPFHMGTYSYKTESASKANSLLLQWTPIKIGGKSETGRVHSPEGVSIYLILVGTYLPVVQNRMSLDNRLETIYV